MDARFQWIGRGAIFISLGCLVLMFSAIFMRGIGAFSQSKIALHIVLDESLLDPITANPKANLTKALAPLFPDVVKRNEKRRLYRLLSSGAGFELIHWAQNHPQQIGSTQTIWLSAAAEVDLYMKGKIKTSLPEELRNLKNDQIHWIQKLRRQGRIKQKFNTAFFTNGDSSEPEMAGILGAMLGSLYSLSICFIISFPLGILTAVYLEEFARKNQLANLIEININNLAAVPSIVFGVLGLSIFLGVFHLPRSTPLVGGMVLALMTLPTIIIAARTALRCVPNFVREAALGLGANKVQTTFHHVVPLAMPGMLTGTILGMAGALGETAPLLMIGMVAFIVDLPSGITDVATSLPVQIFLWADSPEKGFVERTSAAILVLLVFLILMNISAVFLRKKLERKW